MTEKVVTVKEFLKALKEGRVSMIRYAASVSIHSFLIYSKREKNTYSKTAILLILLIFGV